MDRTGDIAEQIRIRDQWSRQHQIWSVTHYAFGILTVMLAVTVAARIPMLPAGDWARDFLAYALALMIGIGLLIEPHKRAERFRRAWSTLAAAITVYSMRGTHCSVEDVVAAQIEGEFVINEFRVAVPPARNAIVTDDDVMAESVAAE